MTRIRRVSAAMVVLVLAATVALSVTGCPQKPVNSSSTAKPLTAADIPLKAGKARAYVSNDPAVNPFLPVEFDASGPWDFSEGPIDTLIVAHTLPAKQGFDARSFRKATVAQLLAIKGREATGTYSYYSETRESYLGYGQASAAMGTNVFSNPERILVFPLKVGSAWTDQVTLRSTPPAKLKIQRKVLGQNVITVPAGKFKDTVMIQVIRTVTQSDGSTSKSTAYEWYSPGVGVVAAIASRRDEPEPMFKEAAFFERLRSYTK